MFQMQSFPPYMLGGLILVMLSGFPVAFSLASLGLACGFYAILMDWFPISFMANLPLNVFGILANDLLLAIPFFTFMGAIIEKCGLAEEMLDSIGQLFDGVRGGLGYSVIIVGFIFGAIIGSVASEVIAMALISLTAMMRHGYSMRYATGVLVAAGTMTQLVPPSLVLIVMADQLTRPVGDMYQAAWGASVLQVLFFVIYTFLIGIFRPSLIPAVPKSARTLQGWRLWIKCLAGILPASALIFAVLGLIGGLPSMESAIATPTEAGAIGCMGTLLLATLRRRISSAVIWQAMHSTMRLTSMVIFILIGSRIFSMVFQGVDGSKWVEQMLSNLPAGQIGFLIVINTFIFLLTFFLNFFEIAFIILPLIAPVANKLGIDLVWFGVTLCVSMQTSFMHPPYGFALFYLRNIADTLFKQARISRPVLSKDIYLGALPWVVMQLLLVLILIFVPQSVTMFLSKKDVVSLDRTMIQIQESSFENTNDIPNTAANGTPSAFPGESKAPQ